MIEYKTGSDVIDWDSLLQLYVETDGVIGLARAGDLRRIKEAFLNSHRIITAWDQDEVIGAGRLISDGVYYGWIHEMAVHPEYQRTGVGRRIMKELLDGHEGLLIGLTSAFGAEGFCHKLGFQKHKTAMALYPGQSIYLDD